MRVSRVTTTVVLLLASATSIAAERDTVTSALSPETRALVIREMQAIDAAMNRVHTALVTGDHATVVENAQAIHDSFVLAQTLSDEQRAEIGELPREFLSADRKFHQLSDRLAKAGKAQDSWAERAWFDEMTRACVACHGEFATGRFPDITKVGGDEAKQ